MKKILIIIIIFLILNFISMKILLNFLEINLINETETGIIINIKTFFSNFDYYIEKEI